jgi:methylated-DNA-[protein]-cysteine S-methyltransferase
MASLGHTLFDTAIGVCGLAWGAHGITAVQLPEPDTDATRARLLKSAGDCPEVTDLPDAVRAAITGIQALLRGEHRQLLELELDLERLTPFQRRAYAIARAIPPGQTRTYGEVAQELGDPDLARAVGQAMGRNPFAPVVPCHRVLAAGLKPGGFSASGGALTKLRMLAIEGAVPGGTPPLFDDL